jgi:hypothetical protein
MKSIVVFLLGLFTLSFSVSAQTYCTGAVTTYERYLVDGREEWDEIGTLFERNTFEFQEDIFYWTRGREKYKFKIAYTDEIKEESSKIVKVKDTKGKYFLVLIEKEHITMTYQTDAGRDIVVIFEITEEH